MISSHYFNFLGIWDFPSSHPFFTSDWTYCLRSDWMYCLRLELRSMVFFVMLVIPLFNPVAPFLTPNSKACTQNILSILKCNLSRYSHFYCWSRSKMWVWRLPGWGWCPRSWWSGGCRGWSRWRSACWLSWTWPGWPGGWSRCRTAASAAASYRSGTCTILGMLLHHGG